MGALGGIHRVDHAHAVHHLRGFRQVVAHEDAVRVGGDCVGGAHHLAAGRFWIEGIDMAHAAVHEEVDHMFCLGLGSCLRGRIGDGRSEHRGEVDTEQGACRAGEEVAACDFVGAEEGIGGHWFSEGLSFSGGRGIPPTSRGRRRGCGSLRGRVPGVRRASIPSPAGRGCVRGWQGRCG